MHSFSQYHTSTVIILFARDGVYFSYSNLDIPRTWRFLKVMFTEERAAMLRVATPKMADNDILKNFAEITY